MTPLEATQKALQRAILSGDTSFAAGLIDPAGLAPERRLRIHRNNFLTTVTDALAATYPVVVRLIGRPCFNGLAKEFIALMPPARPCLFEYGEGFASYIAAVPTLDGLPYLPDVARLEWAMNAARHADDVRPLEPAVLTTLPRARCAGLAFTLHPACRLVASNYPIDRIWQSNQPDADPEMRVSLDDGGVYLLVHRDRDGDVAWLRLSGAAYLFVHALRLALPVEAAWAKAAETDARFDGAALVAALLDGGVFIDFKDPTPQI